VPQFHPASFSHTFRFRLYSYRFGIESCFRELKQQLGGFGYHFWTRAMPKLNHFKKKRMPDPLGEIIE